MIKSFIIDAHTILYSGRDGGSRVLRGFSGGDDANDIFIPGIVLSELDKKKNEGGEVAENAIDFARALDRLREKGDLAKGVPMERGYVFVEPDTVRTDSLPERYDPDDPDSILITSCITLAKRYPERHFVLVSTNVFCRNKADLAFHAANLNIGIEMYRNDHIDVDMEYKGYRIIEDADPDFIDSLRSCGSIDTVMSDDMYEGEYVILDNGDSSVIAVNNDGRLEVVDSASTFWVRNLLNEQQIMAMHALLAPPEEIPLVILTGAAGTGKTFLSIAAGIDRTHSRTKKARYSKIIIAGSNADGTEALAGSVRESIGNMIILTAENHGCNTELEKKVDSIFGQCFEILPLKQLLRRSPRNKFVILDDAQNATRKQIFDVISRAGEGTKVVLTGDIQRVEDPNLTPWNNGLTYALQMMRGTGVAVVHFEPETVSNSFLSKIADGRMQSITHD